MNDLVKFEFEGKGVRTVVIENEPWFVAKDVCDILGIVNSRNAVGRIPEQQKGVHSVDTDGGMQNLSIISEGGLYRLVLRSDKPQAEPFIDWVTGEVLPQIRKTGSYSVTQKAPQTYIEALEALLESEKAKQKLLEDKTELEVKLDEAKEWFSIKRMEKLNPGKKFPWQLLKRESHRLRKPIKKVFDQNYGNVNAYHSSVWESLYFDTLNFE